MKVNCWDKCFLCLTNFGSTSSSSSSSCGGKKGRGRPKRLKINGKLNLGVLIKYLLGDQNDSLLQRIRRLQQPNSTASSSEGLIKFCDKCQDSARRISQLQMELEVIQMKIVDILFSVRKTVISNSNGNDGTSGFSLEELTVERQEILDTLQAFQAAVVEKSKESVHVPLVYIEKFSGCKNLLKTNWATPTPAEEDKLNLIKIEPEADDPLDEILSDFGGHDYDDASTTTPIMEFNEGVEDDHNDRQEERMDIDNDLWTPPDHVKEVKTPKKRGRRPKNPPVPKIKEEPEAEFPSICSDQVANLNAIIKQEDFIDLARKPRSAALTAVKRMADVKNQLSKPSYQYRPPKIAKKTRTYIEIPEPSSRYPNHPAKILLNPILKTGKRFKQPKKSSKKPRQRYRAKKHFLCEFCPYKTTVNFQFEHHLTQHETPGVVNHICPHCTNPQRQFSERQSYDFHMNSHSGLNKMMCDLCSKFLDPFAILEHLRGHSNVEKIFQCPCCSYYCGTRKSYMKHTRFHGTPALICDVCSKKFRNRQRMLEHMHEEHNLLEKIKCDVANCDREFLEIATFEAHKRVHTQAFVCSECNLKFPNAGHLLGHQVRKHSKEKPFQCSECPEKFIDKVALQSHLINAHGAAKFKCPYCSKEYSDQSTLNSHMNLHDGITFACDQCDKVFENRRRLKIHQKIHKTTKDFICEECGKAFRYESLLKNHTMRHNGEKKFKCSYCPKVFLLQSYLVIHERIHTGEKPYVCEACGKGFNQLGPFNQHRRTQHKELIENQNKSGATAAESTSTST